MLERLKLLVNSPDEEKLKLAYEIAIADARAISKLENIEDKAPSTVLKMALFNYNQLDAQGLSSENYTGASFNYLSNYGDDVYNTLKSLSRGIYFVK